MSQLEKGCQRLLDTLPKPGNHYIAQLGCQPSQLKREFMVASNTSGCSARNRPKVAAASLASSNYTGGAALLWPLTPLPPHPDFAASLLELINAELNQLVCSCLRISGLVSQSLFFSWIFNELSLIAAYALAVGCY